MRQDVVIGHVYKLVIGVCTLVIGLLLSLGSWDFKSPMNLCEVKAIHSIRTLHTAETQYMSEFGKYATTLEKLGQAREKDGYVFTLTSTPTGYTINANPKVYNSTGRRAFFSDQSLTIRQSWGQDPATATSPELK